MGVGHYENFPVASLLLPKAYRPAVQALYRFARSADDLADEGEATPEQRLIALKDYEQALTRIEEQTEATLPPALHPVFLPLADVIRRYHLPVPLLRDLLDAFKQDVTTQRYATYTELLDYCRRSANPVGRLILHIHQCATPQHEAWSDAICTALQLINFWQDVGIDWQKNRVYLPQADMRAFGVEEWEIGEARSGQHWHRLMWFQIKRSRALMLSGAPLVHVLPGRVGFELRLVVQGGLRILDKLEANTDVFRHRPVLNKLDWLRLFWRASRMRPLPSNPSPIQAA